MQVEEKGNSLNEWMICKGRDKGMKKLRRTIERLFRVISPPTAMTTGRALEKPKPFLQRKFTHPNAQIAREYQAPKVVPELNSIDEKNELWRKSKEEEKPFLMLYKKRKYASFKYDMWNTPYDLSDDSIEKLKNCFEEFLDELGFAGRKRAFKERSITWSFGRTSGFVDSIRIHEARILAKRMKKITINKDYWVKATYSFMNHLN